jgi:hypothetical protein
MTAPVTPVKETRHVRAMMRQSRTAPTWLYFSPNAPDTSVPSSLKATAYAVWSAGPNNEYRGTVHRVAIICHNRHKCARLWRLYAIIATWNAMGNVMAHGQASEWKDGRHGFSIHAASHRWR